ncbi:N-acyl homoserine lactonase family protein [Paraburkholderia phytofirmans]|uniref:N-acyl homoserine lactonase family protein n=1 Tax=Paraburkholderia phytofirmans TaxID=261302 RepID=UPI0038BADF8F
MFPLKLYAITCGWFQAPVRFFIEGGESEVLRSPIPAYLIEHPKGLALFDTGLGARYRLTVGKRLAQTETGFEFGDSDDIGARLRAMLIDPKEVRWIINSHLHADHCGGNASIPNAKVIIQRREIESARSLAGTPNYDSVDFDTGHDTLEIDGEYDLYGDGSVVIFPTYGHTAGHQCVRVKLPKGDVVLAGDCCYLKRSLDELRLPAHVHDKEQSLRVLELLANMKRRGTRVFYGHDGEFWKDIPQASALE